MSADLWRESQRYLVGGVNSPVRSFKAVGQTPVFIERGKGSKIYDVNHNEYIDYILSWGALILGHCHPDVHRAIYEQLKKGASFGLPTKQELVLAKKISRVIPSIEKLRFTSTGTEAAMAAVRLAKGCTGRKIIIKFKGCYHGASDLLLNEMDPCGLGVLPYNDIDTVKNYFKKYSKKIAAVIVEPVVGNSGVILQEDGFLEGLRRLTKQAGALLIFDEVITGFRFCYGGAQNLYRVKPDITILGKIIGGGLPCAAFGGQSEIMNNLAPLGKVYQAGTFSGNPLSMSAGSAALEVLSKKGTYNKLQDMTEKLCNGLMSLAHLSGIDITCPHIGSMFTIFFKTPKIYAAFFRGMLKEGVLLPPSQFEAAFLSTVHTNNDIEQTLNIAKKAIRRL